MDPQALIVGLTGAGATAAAANVMLERLLGPTLDTLGKGIVPTSLRAWKELRVARAHAIVSQFLSFLPNHPHEINRAC